MEHRKVACCSAPSLKSIMSPPKAEETHMQGPSYLQQYSMTQVHVVQQQGVSQCFLNLLVVVE